MNRLQRVVLSLRIFFTHLRMSEARRDMERAEVDRDRAKRAMYAYLDKWLSLTAEEKRVNNNRL